ARAAARVAASAAEAAAPTMRATTEQQSDLKSMATRCIGPSRQAEATVDGRHFADRTSLPAGYLELLPASLRLAASALSLRNGRERGQTSPRKCTSVPARASSFSP